MCDGGHGGGTGAALPLVQPRLLQRRPALRRRAQAPRRELVERLADEPIVQPRRLPRRLLRHRAEEVVEGGVRAEAIERHLDLEREVAPPRVVEAAHALPPRQRRQRTAHPLDEAARGLSSVAQEGPEHLDDEQAPVLDKKY